jgi:YesN/AraC family two-component response regulator
MEMHRIVVADDEIEFRNWFRSLISGCRDFELVGEAGSGEEALRLVHETNPDLVVADLYMPEPDGLEVIRILSQQSPNTRTILTSANCDPIHQQLAKEEGALAFIPKVSFSLRILRKTLEEEG